jgi:membrane protease YdiL (CAAX protease family)
MGGAVSLWWICPPGRPKLQHSATQEIISMNKVQGLSTSAKNQYTLWQIMGIWLTGGAPIWLLGWVAYPPLSAGLSQVDAGLLRLKLLTVGLIWQFVLAMSILYFEEGNIRLGTIRRRFWLNQPTSARSAKTKNSLWWWIVPLILVMAGLEIGLRPTLVTLWTTTFPVFAEPQGYDASVMFAPELRAHWVGVWSLLGLFFVSALFNTFLGEELLFRGVLLPKMAGVFGRWDCVANGILFSLYHLHQPWCILATLPAALVLGYSGKRFHSNWFPIVLHSGQSVYFLFLILGLVLGLA